MTEPMTDERLENARSWLDEGPEYAETTARHPGVVLKFARGLLAEVDRLKRERAEMQQAHVNDVAESTVLREENAKLEAALDCIRCSGSSVPLGMEPEDFYRAQMLKSIGTAAHALAALGETP